MVRRKCGFGFDRTGGGQRNHRKPSEIALYRDYFIVQHRTLQLRVLRIHEKMLNMSTTRRMSQAEALLFHRCEVLLTIRFALCEENAHGNQIAQ